MPNIHSIHDRPTSEPFPNIPPPSYSMNSGDSEMSYSMSPGLSFQYIGIDGDRYTYQSSPNQPANPLHMCGLMCCPCFVPPLMSEEKKLQYKNLAMTFNFWISILQFFIVIILVSVGGITSFSENPSIGPPGPTLRSFGAKDTNLIQKGQIWRLISPIFLHAGFIHVLFNIFAQLRFGVHLEKKWKIKFYCAIYFISGIFGVISSCIVEPQNLGVGASGAILGIIGAFLAESIILWHELDPRTRMANVIQASAIILISILIGASKYVDLGAHAGGALSGFILGFILFGKQSQNPYIQKYAMVAGTVSLAVWVFFGLIYVFVIL